MGRAEVTPWERFLALLESNDVPVYQVCSVLEMEEDELKKKSATQTLLCWMF